jgi:hypothetical protein
MTFSVAKKLETGRILVIDPVADRLWDKFVLDHPYGWITHLSGWKTVLEKSFPHMRGHYFAIADYKGNIESALPLYEVNSWLLGKKLVSIPFATLSDPLVSNTIEAEILTDHVKGFSEEKGIERLEIRTLHAAPYMKVAGMHSASSFATHFLELENPDILKKRFHYKSIRYEINKAEKNHLKLSKAGSEADLKSFYRLYTKTRKRLCLPPQPYRFFKSLWDQFHPGNLDIYFAECDMKQIAALLVFKFKNRVSAEALGWDIDYEKASPNHFMFWNAIKAAYEEGYKIFDFGRTAKSNTGLMNFKSRWGTSSSDIVHFNFPSNGENIPRENTKAYDLVKLIFRVAPEALTPILGNFCYRHMG